MTNQQLAKKAISAKKLAYAPYSNFHVGAALLDTNNEVFIGCNIESAAFSPTCCAERTALVKAVSEGSRTFTSIAVAGSLHGADSHDYCYPCGVCRQMLYEFGGDELQVIVVKSEQDFKVHTLSELLPYGFGADNMEALNANI